MAAVCVPVPTTLQIAKHSSAFPSNRSERQNGDDNDEQMSDDSEGTHGPVNLNDGNITHADSEVADIETTSVEQESSVKAKRLSVQLSVCGDEKSMTVPTSNSPSCRSLVLYNPTSSPWSLVPRFKVNPSHEATLNTEAIRREEKEKALLPVGLRNLGNTCYFNSALQMLMSLEGFGDDMIRLVRELKELQAKYEDNDGFVLVDDEVVAQQSSLEHGHSTSQENAGCQQKDADEVEEAEEIKPQEAKKAKISVEIENEGTIADKSQKEEKQQEQTDDDDPMFGCFGLFGDDDAGGYNIVSHEETKENQAGDSELLSLREALVSVWERAQSNARQEVQEPVSPKELKRAVDVATPLFIGYRQQDAHEFLSTLLDLLHDEIVAVHKEIRDKEKKMKDENSTVCTPAFSEEPVDEHVGVLITEATESHNEKLGQGHSAASEPEQTSTEEESASEPMLMDNDVDSDEKASVTHETEEADPSFAVVPKYSQLNVAAIQDLLHGADESSNESEIALREETKSTGRLVGGRAIPTNDGVVVSSSRTEAMGDDISLDWNEVMSPSTSSLPVGSERRPGVVVTETADTGENRDDKKRAVRLNDANPTTECGRQDNGASEGEVPLPMTPIDDFFTVELRTRLTCNSCKFSRTRKEVFRHLSIEVSNNDTLDKKTKTPTPAPTSSTVQEGLRQFFATEKLELKCEKCYHETATQTKEITRLPKALLIHFKRFIVDVSPDYRSVTYRKDQTEMEFGDCLELSTSALKGDSVLAEFLAPDVSIPQLSERGDDETEETVGMDCSMSSTETLEDDDTVPISNSVHNMKRHMPHYKLRSIVNHIGNSANCGHYTADADALCFLPNSRSDARRWTRFNDSRVTETSLQAATTGSARTTAYMIMYALE